MAPSLTIALSKARSPALRPASLLLIGAPDYSGTLRTAREAANEVREIQARFPGYRRRSTRVRLGRPRTPIARRIRRGFRLFTSPRTIEANADNPLESSVILSHKGEEYKLYARDVIDIPNPSRLVTISACRKAQASDAYAGEGLIRICVGFLTSRCTGGRRPDFGM